VCNCTLALRNFFFENLTYLTKFEFADYHPLSQGLNSPASSAAVAALYSIMLSMLSASAGFNGPALAGSRSSIRVSMDTNIVECPGPVSKVQAVANPGSSAEFAQLKTLAKQLNPVVGYYDPLSAPPPLLLLSPVFREQQQLACRR